MKKQLFNTYTNNIRNILSSNQGLSGLNERFSNFTGSIENLEKAEMGESLIIEPNTGLRDLANLLGIKVIKKPFKGDHPHFTDLRVRGGYEHHYIVSMFLDVRNSTKLHYNYDLVQIARVIQTIVVAATQTCALFGGHIQRIQYDGVFVYFGGKGIDKKQAIQDAINAASFFNYFVKYELRELFEMEDINRIYTRVGLDFGDDKDVMWTIFGLPGCDELTTNSLHTSLPAKMQSNAPNNGIIVGQNIPTLFKGIDSYCDFFRDDRGNIDSSRQHIFKMPDGSFNYAQKVFKWESYLKNTFAFVKADESGKLYIDDQYSPSDEAERKRVAELLKETQIMKDRQTIFNQNTRKEVPITPHNFHSNGTV